MADFEEKGIFGSKKLNREKIEDFIQMATTQNILYKKSQEDLNKGNTEIRKMIDLYQSQKAEKQALEKRLQKAEELVKSLQQKLDFSSDKYLFEKTIDCEKREKELFEKGL